MKPGYLTKVKVKLKFQSDVKPCGTNSVEIVDGRKILLKNLLALENTSLFSLSLTKMCHCLGMVAFADSELCSKPLY